jgi:hypothetical protein
MCSNEPVSFCDNLRVPSIRLHVGEPVRLLRRRQRTEHFLHHLRLEVLDGGLQLLDDRVDGIRPRSASLRDLGELRGLLRRQMKTQKLVRNTNGDQAFRHGVTWCSWGAHLSRERPPAGDADQTRAHPRAIECRSGHGSGREDDGEQSRPAPQSVAGSPWKRHRSAEFWIAHDCILTGHHANGRRRQRSPRQA